MTAILERKLNDGQRIPGIGLGTWPLKGEECARAVLSAIEAGYRLLDTAMNYDNEAAVGEGIRRSGLDREEFFLSSKLPGRWHDRRLTVQAVEESLFRMGVDSLDLYLIHWPNPAHGRYREAWEGLLEARSRGLVRSVGVCNFTPGLLREILPDGTPAVNQIEVYPYWSKPETRAFNDQHGILTEGWSPLGRGRDLLSHPVVVELARTKDRTPAQVVLRWAVEHGVLPLPKSSSPDRQRENLDVFDFALNAEERSRVDALNGSRPDVSSNDPLTYKQM